MTFFAGPRLFGALLLFISSLKMSHIVPAISPIVGATKAIHLEDEVGALGVKLSAEDTPRRGIRRACPDTGFLFC